MGFSVQWYTGRSKRGTFPCPPVALNIGQFFVTPNHLLSRQSQIRGLYHQHAIDDVFPRQYLAVFPNGYFPIGKRHLVEPQQPMIPQIIANQAMGSLGRRLAALVAEKSQLAQLFPDPGIGCAQTLLVGCPDVFSSFEEKRPPQNAPLTLLLEKRFVFSLVVELSGQRTDHFPACWSASTDVPL